MVSLAVSYNPAIIFHPWHSISILNKYSRVQLLFQNKLSGIGPPTTNPLFCRHMCKWCLFYGYKLLHNKWHDTKQFLFKYFNYLIVRVGLMLPWYSELILWFPGHRCGHRLFIVSCYMINKIISNNFQIGILALECQGNGLTI